MFVSMKYNDLRKLTTFCAGIAQLGTDAVSTSVFLSTTPEGLKAETSTAEVWAQGTLPADIAEDGEVLVPGKTLADVVRALAADPGMIIDIAASEDEIDIRTADGSVFRTLNTIPVGDFKSRPIPPSTNRVKVSPDIAEWISKASFAASTDTYAGPLAGVHLHEKGIAATDKYRFILLDFDWDGIEPVTIPVDLIKRFPSPEAYGDGDIYLATSDQYASMEFGPLVISGSVLQGEYPDPEQIKTITPAASTPYKFEVPVTGLKKLIGQLAPMLGPMGGATLHEDGIVRVQSDIGRGEDRLFADELDLPAPVKMNVAFMRNVIGLFKDQEACMFKFHETKPDLYPFVITEGNVMLGSMPMKVI